MNVYSSSTHTKRNIYRPVAIYVWVSERKAANLIGLSQLTISRDFERVWSWTPPYISPPPPHLFYINTPYILCVNRCSDRDPHRPLSLYEIISSNKKTKQKTKVYFKCKINRKKKVYYKKETIQMYIYAVTNQ